MKSALMLKQLLTMDNTAVEHISELSTQSFRKIAPFWPLKNLIAVNPLQGLEDRPIEEAIKLGATYFQQAELPEPMERVNRETIKWLQVYFDEGQSIISMPFRKEGLLAAWRRLAKYDAKLHGCDTQKQEWLESLPETAEQVIIKILLQLNIAPEDQEQFLTLLLTTLPGWAGYIKYRTEWADQSVNHLCPVTQTDYIAMRLSILSLLWPEAKALLNWHKQSQKHTAAIESLPKKMQDIERSYRLNLLEKLAPQKLKTPHTPEAQLVFCIDVRSELFRKALESTGDYQTFGFAGFFGVPVHVTNTVTGEAYASCPVLLTPKHKVKESPILQEKCAKECKGYERLSGLKTIYHSLKNTFVTPFALVEGFGIMIGAWMGLRSLAPQLASKLKACMTQIIYRPQEVAPSLDNMTLAQQCTYAEGALRMMGLIHHFAPLIVLCGHGSTTQNNAYATSLDCGACGGRHGASNARILAAILNCSEVKRHLAQNGIIIPETTRFIAAEHNTTTDEMTLFGCQESEDIKRLKKNFEKAKNINSAVRLQQMRESVPERKSASVTWCRSQDWAQVRPEWGLARNTAFIVAPRDLTASLDLEGRCFLHSYDYKGDPECRLLSTILTAPMVVAQWINTQYLFSTLDNVAYGGGSKITKNITGKIGIMQGNASDLMTGLPLQSVYISDTEPYHEPQRLMTVVFAPCQMLDTVIREQAVLQKLFGNGWVQLACIEPDSRKTYFLDREFKWHGHQ